MNFKCYDIAKKADVRGALPRLILVHLAVHADADGEAWPSLKTLAEICGTNKASICRGLTLLIESGILEMKRGGGRGNSTIYRFVKGCPGDTVSDEKGYQGDTVLNEKGCRSDTLSDDKGCPGDTVSDEKGYHLDSQKGITTTIKGITTIPEVSGREELIEEKYNTPPNPRPGVPADAGCACAAQVDDASQAEKQADSKLSPPATRNEPVKTEWLMELWNAEACKALPRCREWTEKRRKAARARIQEHPDREEWLTAIRYMNDEPFYQGDGNRGWVADIDYLLRPDTLTKLIEKATVAEPHSAPSTFFSNDRLRSISDEEWAKLPGTMPRTTKPNGNGRHKGPVEMRSSREAGFVSSTDWDGNPIHKGQRMRTEDEHREYLIRLGHSGEKLESLMQEFREIQCEELPF